MNSKKDKEKHMKPLHLVFVRVADDEFGAVFESQNEGTSIEGASIHVKRDTPAYPTFENAGKIEADLVIG